jgi:hypothetical protein
VLSSPGQPLDAATRGLSESRMGYDFSRVRVYSNDAAAQSTQDVHARAYTVVQDIAFGMRQFSPATRERRRQIAGELAHVVQQTGGQGSMVGRAPERAGGSILRQLLTKRRADVGFLQRQPANGPEIEMPPEYAFAIDKRKRRDKRYARSLGQQDAVRLRKAGTLSSADRDEVNAKLGFFEGEAKEVYIREIRPVLVEVTRKPIEMPAESMCDIAKKQYLLESKASRPSQMHGYNGRPGISA